VQLHDVVAELFGEHRPGALRLSSERPFEAWSQTSSSGGCGTFGQAIPALNPDDSHKRWLALLGAANRLGPLGVRSNLGIVNTTDDWARVVVMVVDQENHESFATAFIPGAPPHEWLQQDLLELVRVPEYETDHAMVYVYTYADGLLAYLSRIDNRSGDASLVLPVSGQPVYIVPALWEVAITLTYSGSVNLSSIVYDGELGENVTVDDPESGWSATLSFTSPAEFCYQATGETGDTGGSVTVMVERTRTGETPYLDRASQSNPGAGSVLVEECFDLY
jgi:hypothetical protein